MDSERWSLPSWLEAGGTVGAGCVWRGGSENSSSGLRERLTQLSAWASSAFLGAGFRGMPLPFEGKDASSEGQGMAPALGVSTGAWSGSLVFCLQVPSVLRGAAAAPHSRSLYNQSAGKTLGRSARRHDVTAARNLPPTLRLSGFALGWES